MERTESDQIEKRIFKPLNLRRRTLCAIPFMLIGATIGLIGSNSYAQKYGAGDCSSKAKVIQQNQDIRYMAIGGTLGALAGFSVYSNGKRITDSLLGPPGEEPEKRF